MNEMNPEPGFLPKWFIGGSLEENQALMLKEKTLRLEKTFYLTLAQEAKRRHISASRYLCDLIARGYQEEQKTHRKRDKALLDTTSSLERYLLKFTLENLLLTRHFLSVQQADVLAEVQKQVQILFRQVLEKCASESLAINNPASHHTKAL